LESSWGALSDGTIIFPIQSFSGKARISISLLTCNFISLSSGEVHYGKNGNHIAVLLHIDKTIPMWAFFDVYGNTQRIKMLGEYQTIAQSRTK
jgi:hypothetical protein